MKKRAVQKRDVSDFMKRVDVKGTVVMVVLVDGSGGVRCLRTLVGLDKMRAEVDKAVRQWKFQPMTSGGKAFSYVGEMEFTLCNISCGDGGFSMSIVQ
jgi:hypothetical protein